MIVYDKLKHNAETHREFAQSRITSEVWWVAESDRWIFVQWDNENNITALNYMQGQETRADVVRANEELLAFYYCMISNFFPRLNGEDVDLGTIDKICWAYHECDVIFGDKY
jgi:hypothetical protein